MKKILSLIVIGIVLIIAGNFLFQRASKDVGLVFNDVPDRVARFEINEHSSSETQIVEVLQSLAWDKLIATSISESADLFKRPGWLVSKDGQVFWVSSELSISKNLMIYNFSSKSWWTAKSLSKEVIYAKDENELNEKKSQIVFNKIKSVAGVPLIYASLRPPAKLNE